MPGPALVLVHGRSQQMAAASRGDPAVEAAFVQRKKRGWLSGLAKGLTLAGLPAVDEADVYYPYYGNLFVDAITKREKAGLVRPELEVAVEIRPESVDALIFDSAQLLGFTPGAGVDDGERGGRGGGRPGLAELHRGPGVRLRADPALAAAPGGAAVHRPTWPARSVARWPADPRGEGPRRQLKGAPRRSPGVSPEWRTTPL
jgi:hypothetical protein